MTYKAAIFGLERLGIPTHPTPRIYCDGCGAPCEVPGKRRDWCPKCKEASQ